METGNLGTTNVILGIMAAVSVLEALMLIVVSVAAFLMYRRAMTLFAELEERHVVPVRQKVDAILASVETVAARVNHQTERVDQAIAGTFDRVDETAARVRRSVRDRVSEMIGVVRGVRAVLMSIFQPSPEPMGEGWQSANR